MGEMYEDPGVRAASYAQSSADNARSENESLKQQLKALEARVRILEDHMTRPKGDD